MQSLLSDAKGMIAMNYSELKRQLLVALRGTHSQKELSYKLGFSFNQVGKWESNAKILKWTDFHDLCLVSGRPLEGPMREVFLAVHDDIRNPVTMLNALRAYNSTKSYEELAAALHCHVSVVRRWYSGAVCPEIEAVFALMNLRKGFLSLFISKLTSLDNVPIIQAQNLEDEIDRKIISQDPDMDVIKLCLRLEEYKKLAEHSDSFISERSSLPVAEIRPRLQLLEANGEIIQENGKWKPLKPSSPNLTGDQKSFASFRRHWIEKNLRRYQVPEGVPPNLKHRPNFQSCFVFTASKGEVDLIFDILNKCFEEIRQLYSPDPQPEDDIRVLLMDFFSPDDVPMKTSTAAPTLPMHEPQL